MSQAHIKNYRRDIDGLRAISVLIVVAFHAFPEWLPGGFIGVDVFFVISGFLISGIILNDIENGRFSIARFYHRRVRRIFPALIVVLLSVLAAGWFLLSTEEYKQLGWHVLASGLFFQNITLFSESGYFDVVADYKPLLHLWSLSVEEQFYLVYPLLLLFFAKSKRLLFAVGSIAALSMCACMFQTYILADSTGSFFLPHNRFWELMAGSIVQIVMRNRQQVANPFLAVVGIALLGIGVFLTDRYIPFPSLITMLPVLGAMLVLMGNSNSTFSKRVLGSGVIVFIGLISYPLYLIHWPIFSFARIFTAHEPAMLTKWVMIIASFILAALTYLLIERPLRFGRTKGKSSVLDWRIGLILVGMVIAICAGYCVNYYNGIASRAIGGTLGRHMHERFKVGIEIENRYKHGSCDREPLVDRRLLPGCLMYGPKDAEETIVVWGDSHAEAWSSAFFDIAKRFGKRVILFRQLGCAPILDVVRTDGGAHSQNCATAERAAAAVSTVQKLKPKHVFLVARWSLYPNGWYVGGKLQPATHFLSLSPSVPATRDTSRRAIESKLPETLYALAEAAPVTVIKTIPVLRASAESVFLKRTTPTSREEHRKNESFAVRIIEDAIRDAPRSLNPITTMDPASLVCDEKQCAISINNIVMYRDDNHITPQGSLLFENEILRTMK